MESEKRAESSESFWPRFKRRIKRDRKSKTYEYAVQISPARDSLGKPEAFVRILSLSRGGDVIPVAIVSPVEEKLAATEISVKSQKSEENEAAKGKTDRRRRSWVRVVVRALKIPTKREGGSRKVRQAPPQSKVTEATAVEPEVPVAATNAHSDSIPRPAEVRNSVCKLKSIGFQRKVRAHASAPCSPKKRLSTPPASFVHLSHPDGSMLTNTASLPVKIHRLGRTVLDSNDSVPKDEDEAEGCDAAIVVSILLVAMVSLALWDKLIAVLCTSTWFYAVPVFRRTGKFKDPAVPKRPRRGKMMTKSLSNDHIDLQSSEYRKKVIMEGILQRNHKGL